ncbi:phosphatidylinositol 5-phosphate 4-kinase type-2 gamma [Myiozetetes cayanensis]|uniref:phosphatidylinositol 5-phosphate 4-kinase type-2 gamma n=1 Tax=Myiozetetes cayanensis TaxID=478635 RepID=UPI00215F671F|nr:phosphatidylinositol 5-phosphate 4-kinase type-2 gamma [Myiozetetes cayanensis]
MWQAPGPGPACMSRCHRPRLPRHAHLRRGLHPGPPGTPEPPNPGGAWPGRGRCRGSGAEVQCVPGGSGAEVQCVPGGSGSAAVSVPMAAAAAAAPGPGPGPGPGAGPGPGGPAGPTGAASVAAPAAGAAAGAARTKKKQKQKRFVPQRVKPPRAAEPLLAVLAWGVTHQINELAQVPLPVMLLPDDFKASSKIKVNNHLFNRESLPSHFKFKEYCPQVFRNLRERFGIDDTDYQVSLARHPPRWSQTSPRLLLSADRTLVLKELSSEGVADLHGLLAHYHQYVVQVHGQTLLPQFLGMYRVSVDSEERYLLVMRNLFSHRLPLHRKYDLKGSLVDREASDKEKGKELPTLKDVDFLNNNEKVFVGPEQQRHFMDKLRRDVEFLVQQKLMGYSLLLGIHDLERGEQDEEEEPEEEEPPGDEGGWGPYGTSPEGLGGLLNSYRPPGPGELDPAVDVYGVRGRGAPRRELYFMGLVDVLTQYDARRKAAHAAKTVKHGAGAEISTVHPEQYAKRFLDFISNIFA